MNTRTAERHPLGLVGAFSAVACWGAGNIMVREAGLDSIPLALWRLVLGVVVYAAIMLVRRRWITWPQLWACVPPALAAGLWIIVFYEALKSTTITNATMIGALMPLVLFAVAARRFGEHVSGWLVGLAATGLAGTALVLYGSVSVPTWSARGDALAALALALFSVYFVLAKEARKKVGALEFQAAVWAVGVVVVAPVAAATDHLFMPTATDLAWAAALLAIPGTGHLLMNWAHRHVQLTVASMAKLLAPPVSMVGAAVFLDEPITVLQAIGGAIVLAVLAAVIRRDLQLLARHGASPEGGQPA
ncbi:MAG: DMT family transporter [Acidimicrobiaceae bacterium]|nr:DMT family transporter [Acidimicrobiaceae bacterium]MYE66402.1 DMT family transporter [Acidimicrobiaceae bacterium]